jgi:DNA-binding NarL/FixJ family response regulator
MLSTKEPIRLLIADDHSIIKEGLKNVFSGQNDIALVALASNGKEAIELAAKEKPDVIIMDIKMPLVCGREACHQIRRQCPEIKIIAFSMFDDEENLLQMRMAGACGYLLKNTDVKEVYKAIRVVHEGGEYYSGSIRERTNHLFRTGRLGPALDDKRQDYTTAELKIIKLICEEKTSKEIADSLQMNKRTVEHHRERIQEKMGVQGSVGIAVFALQNWLLC